jgi:D-beta-D-heptose 7-phosphate kinase/D-beta-D-heptose 1-phosphate adenosyltransferase
LFQLDQRDDNEISGTVGNEVVSQVEKGLPESDLVIISDYRHGLLSQQVLKTVLPRIHAAGKLVYVDSQVSQISGNHALYRGGCVICLNLREARSIDSRFTPSRDAGGFAVLNRELDTNRIVVKLGQDGAMFQNGSRVTHAPANSVPVADTTGAGDAFLSAFCLVGMNNPEAALQLGNAWAGLSVQIHGTVPPKKADLLKVIREL